MKKRKRNPATATEMAESFHGRPALETIELVESEGYDPDLAVIGLLEELEVISDDGKTLIPINFSHDDARSAFGRNGDKLDNVYVCCDAAGTQIYFVGGDQEIPVEELTEDQKVSVSVGECYSITYWTDKHHLAGERGFGSYQHEFAEEGGRRPLLGYNTADKRLSLIGGSYTIEDVGIKD